MVRQSLISLFLLVAARGQTVSEMRDHIVRYEGYSHRAYHDKGHLAIGIGHRLLRGERATEWTDAQIRRAFDRDLAIARIGASRAVSNLSTQPEIVRILVISLGYNVGNAGLREFRLFDRAIEQRDYDEAARQLHMSLWSRQLPARSDDYCSILHRISRPLYILPDVSYVPNRRDLP